MSHKNCQNCRLDDTGWFLWLNEKIVKWASQKPKVKLVGFIQKPYDLAVATARTCYSSKGIISVEEVSLDDKNRDLRDKIALSTKEAGHLTTRQHAHFVFSMENISRSFI